MGTPKTLSSPNPIADGDFGFSSAVSGNYVVVGAYQETASGDAKAGNAYVYSASTGSLLYTLTSPNAQAGGSFGFSVSVSADYVVVGAPEETAGGTAGAGHAYLFSVASGTLLETLASPNSAAQTDGLFGFSVGVSGTNVIVGAYRETDTSQGVTTAGNAYIFSASSGSLLHTLNTPSPTTGGRFGYSVAINGTAAVVGAPYETADSVTQAGNAYIFNAATGSLAYTLDSANKQTSGHFGWSVAASGTAVIVGAIGETAAGLTEAGNAYAFNPGTGSLLYSLTSPNPIASGDFGRSVSATGSLVAVGAPGETASGDAGAGNAYLYNAGAGSLFSTLTSANVQAGGGFGISVAVSGTTIVVGAWNETAAGDDGAGHAYAFSTSSGSASNVSSESTYTAATITVTSIVTSTVIATVTNSTTTLTSTVTGQATTATSTAVTTAVYTVAGQLATTTATSTAVTTAVYTVAGPLTTTTTTSTATFTATSTMAGPSRAMGTSSATTSSTSPGLGVGTLAGLAAPLTVVSLVAVVGVICLASMAVLTLLRAADGRKLAGLAVNTVEGDLHHAAFGASYPWSVQTHS